MIKFNPANSGKPVAFKGGSDESKLDEIISLLKNNQPKQDTFEKKSELAPPKTVFSETEPFSKKVDSLEDRMNFFGEKYAEVMKKVNKIEEEKADKSETSEKIDKLEEEKVSKDTYKKDLKILMDIYNGHKHPSYKYGGSTGSPYSKLKE
jgi:hypothetical protein